MSKKYIFYALLVTLLWGCNFICIKISFAEVPPLLCLTIRFLAVSLPFLLFVKPPVIPFKQLIYLALFQWVIQFSLTYSAMYMGISAGLSALLLQSQTIFTILLSCIIFKSRPTINQIIGISIAFCGLLIIAVNSQINASYIAIVMIGFSALSASFANVMYKNIKEDNALSLIVWSSLIAAVPLLMLSLYFEGWELITASLSNISLKSSLAIAYTSVVSSLIATTIWAFLMKKFKPDHVVPFMLLIPVVATVMGILVLDEAMTLNNLLTSGLIILGLGINQIPASKWQMFRRKLAQS